LKQALEEMKKLKLKVSVLEAKEEHKEEFQNDRLEKHLKEVLFKQYPPSDFKGKFNLHDIL
jgi:hypothetical protein